jgi:hypothetical protein
LLIKAISAAEYDDAVRRSPSSCPLHLRGDRRSAAALLDLTADSRWPAADWSAAAGRFEELADDLDATLRFRGSPSPDPAGPPAGPPSGSPDLQKDSLGAKRGRETVSAERAGPLPPRAADTVPAVGGWRPWGSADEPSPGGGDSGSGELAALMSWPEDGPAALLFPEFPSS